MRESVTAARCQHRSMEEGVGGAMARLFALSGSCPGLELRLRRGAGEGEQGERAKEKSMDGGKGGGK